MVCVGLVDLLDSLKASQKIIGAGRSSSRYRCTCWWDAGRITGGGASSGTGRGAGTAAGGGPDSSAEPAGPALAGPGDGSATGSAWALMLKSEAGAAALAEVLVDLLGPINLISASNTSKSDLVSLRLHTTSR